MLVVLFLQASGDNKALIDELRRELGDRPPDKEMQMDVDRRLRYLSTAILPKLSTLQASTFCVTGGHVGA